MFPGYGCDESKPTEQTKSYLGAAPVFPRFPLFSFPCFFLILQPKFGTIRFYFLPMRSKHSTHKHTFTLSPEIQLTLPGCGQLDPWSAMVGYYDGHPAASSSALLNGSRRTECEQNINYLAQMTTNTKRLRSNITYKQKSTTITTYSVVVGSWTRRIEGGKA